MYLEYNVCCTFKKSMEIIEVQKAKNINYSYFFIYVQYQYRCLFLR